MRLTNSRRARGPFAAALLLVVVAGCSSSEDTQDSWTEPDSGTQPMTAPSSSSSSSPSWSSSPQQPSSGMQEGNFQEAVARQRAIQEKQRVLSEQFVQMGRRYTEEGRLRDALKAYADAVEADPENKAAQQGYDQVAGLLGRTDKVFIDNWDMVRAGQAQAATLAQERFNLGTMAFNEGDYDTAVEEFRSALTILKARPAISVDFDESRVRAAIADAEARRKAAAQASERERVNDIQRIAEEREAEERRRAQANVDRLWNQALRAFERERFEESARLCDTILQYDPQNDGAVQLKEESRRANIAKATSRNIQSYREQWQSVLQELKNLSVPFGNDPVFPPSDKWRKVVQRGARQFSPGTTEINEADEEVRRALEGTLLSSVDWTATPLADALNFIRNNTGINIIVKKAVDDEVPEEERELNLTLENISALSALEIAVRNLNLTYEIRDSMVQITTAADVRRNKVVEFYDVRDLTAKLNNFAGEELNLNPSGVGGGIEGFDDFGGDEEEEIRVLEIDQLIEMIQQSVDKVSWEDDPTNTIKDKSGTLVVRQTPKNQRAIRKLLNDLRKSIGVQVRIQTRFISVENNFLQDIGVDFRGLGDDSGGVGVPGPGPNVTFDDFGQPGSTSIGSDLSAGAFYSREVDIRARTQNLFDLALGNPDVLTPEGGLSLQYAFLGDTQVEAILRAVQKYERVNQVTAPSLTVYNTQRANLAVTRELAYLKDFDVEIAQASVVADPVVDVVREGVILDVRPIVHSDRRFVTLELRPSVATLQRPIRLFTSSLGVGSGVTIEVPELRKESLKTTVVMPDGGTLLLGGLKFFEEQDYESGVPILKDIPIVSLLFSRKGKYTNMRDLIVLLKVDVLIMEEYEPTLVGN